MISGIFTLRKHPVALFTKDDERNQFKFGAGISNRIYIKLRDVISHAAIENWRALNIPPVSHKCVVELGRHWFR